MSEIEYTPTGYFADRQVGHFKPCVVDGKLDTAVAKARYGLNDAQLPLLEIELEAAALLPKVAQEGKQVDIPTGLVESGATFSTGPAVKN